MTAEQAYAFAEDIIKGPFPEGEHVIASVPEVAVNYARFILERRWPECEEAILEEANIETIWSYLRWVIKAPWPEAEEIIKSTKETTDAWQPRAYDVSYACKYANYYLEGRWPEAEEGIMKSTGWSIVWYAKNLVEGRWLEAEPFLLKCGPWAVYNYIEQIFVTDTTRYKAGDWPEGEEVIITSPMVTAHFAGRILHSHWDWVENRISPNPWRKDVITSDAKAASRYARWSPRRRWPEAEAIILTDPEAASEYALECIGDEWPEFEAIYGVLVYEEAKRDWCYPSWWAAYKEYCCDDDGYWS
jgi:hypothetical protein